MTSSLADIWMAGGRDLFLASPELALVGTIALILLAPLAVGRSARQTGALALLGVIAAAWMTFRVAGAVLVEPASVLAPSWAAGMLVVDNLGVSFKLILLLFMAGIIALWWTGRANSERDAPEFFVLLLGSALGMALMVGTLNLLMIVVAIELASLPSYAIVGFEKRDRRGAEVALKYAIFGAISAAIMLYGASLLFGLYQSLSVPEVARGVMADLAGGRNTATVSVALLCFFCGVGFKVSAVPFHFWCPDAFEGARIEVTTWLSVASKAAGLLLLLRLVQTFSAAAAAADAMARLLPLAWTLGVVAAVTCTVGNFAAYRQSSVKRLLAYSSIAHAGYMLMAVAIFAAPGGATANHAIAAVLVYVFVYLFMNLGAFGITGLVQWQTGSDSLDAFNGLVRRSPALAVPMLFCLMSLVGLPPFAGFLAKYWLLYALAGQGAAFQWLYWILFVVAVLNTLFSLYYYLRVVVRMMLVDDGQPALTTPVGGAVLANICGIVLLVIVVFAGPIKRAADGYSVNLYDGEPAASLADASPPGLGTKAGAGQ